jgi:hypothetical protein
MSRRSRRLRHNTRMAGKHAAVKDAKEAHNARPGGKGLKDARRKYARASRKEAKRQLKQYKKR